MSETWSKLPVPRNPFIVLLIVLFMHNFNGIVTAKGPNAVHPNYDITNLREVDWKPHGITGLGWMGDDILVAAEWGGVAKKESTITREGQLHLLYGITDAEGPEDVAVETVLQGLAQPMGVLVMDDTIYLHEKGDDGSEIFKVWNAGAEWKHELYLSGWGKGDGYSWHSWPGGLVYKDGYLHFNVSVHMGRTVNRSANPPNEHGTYIKADFKTGEYEVMARGMRTNESTWLGPWDEVFTSDNQGNWMPDNKVYYLRKGAYYGYGNGAGNPENPPMAYCPHNVACESPGGGTYLRKGLFKGQMLVAEHDYQGINRYFIERINGELQACVFDFGSTPQDQPFGGAHSQRVITGPDLETIYYGCAGDGAIGWVAGPWLGSIAKLTPNGNIGFEMLAIRSLGSTAFEIEFSKPADPVSASELGNYIIETFTRVPAGGYGAGAMEDHHPLSVSSVSIVPGSDSRKVKLEFAPGDLSTGTVAFEGEMLQGIGYTVAFELEGITSAEGEELFDNIAYYTLNQFGPGENPVPGCMTAEDVNFDPLANDHWEDLCVGVSSVERKAHGGLFRVSGSDGRLSVSVPGRSFSCDIYNAAGERLASGHNLRRYAPESLFNPGLYIVRITTGDRSYQEKVIVH